MTVHSTDAQVRVTLHDMTQLNTPHHENPLHTITQYTHYNTHTLSLFPSLSSSHSFSLSHTHTRTHTHTHSFSLFLCHTLQHTQCFPTTPRLMLLLHLPCSPPCASVTKQPQCQLIKYYHAQVIHTLYNRLRNRSNCS